MFKNPLVAMTTFPMNLISLLVLYFLYLHHVCNAQELVESDTDCDACGNCTNVASCIRTYRELESYVKGNKALVEAFKYTYFVTGEIPTVFVKIIYDFQVSDTSDDNVMSCFNHQTTYIWSQKLLYLLGPRPLFWYTHFAVHIPENKFIIINLPCLCRDVYGHLLSRLTYMVWHKGVCI